MKNNKQKINSGFTLIEMLIYIALFSIMMGGLVVVVFQLSQNAGKLSSKNITQEEINFALKKIDWALTSASGASVNISTSEISFNNPQAIIINLSSGNHIQMKINGVVNPLTTKNVKVTNLSFQYMPRTKIMTNLNWLQKYSLQLMSVLKLFWEERASPSSITAKFLRLHI